MELKPRSQEFRRGKVERVAIDGRIGIRFDGDSSKLVYRDLHTLRYRWILGSQVEDQGQEDQVQSEPQSAEPDPTPLVEVCESESDYTEPSDTEELPRVATGGDVLVHDWVYGPHEE